MKRFHAMFALCTGLCLCACGSTPADRPLSHGLDPAVERVEIAPRVDPRPAPPPAAPLAETAVDEQPPTPRGEPTMVELQALYAAMRQDIRDSNLEAGLERSTGWADQLEFAAGDPRRELGNDIFLLSKFIENMIERERAGGR